MWKAPARVWSCFISYGFFHYAPLCSLSRWYIHCVCKAPFPSATATQSTLQLLLHILFNRVLTHAHTQTHTHASMQTHDNVGVNHARKHRLRLLMIALPIEWSTISWRKDIKAEKWDLNCTHLNLQERVWNCVFSIGYICLKLFGLPFTFSREADWGSIWWNAGKCNITK